jgi:hypothetical protein
MAEQAQPAPATDTGGGANQGNADDGKQRGRRNRQQRNKSKWKEGNTSNVSNIPKENLQADLKT